MKKIYAFISIYCNFTIDILKCKSFETLLIMLMIKKKRNRCDFFREKLGVYYSDTGGYKRIGNRGKVDIPFRDGKNTNFSSKSCPSYSMDLIHAETLVFIRNIIEGNYLTGISELNETSTLERKDLIKDHDKYWK